ncbi:MAG: L,D-transpeptidase [Gammaproteobacteria bacterium]|nr:L,D-transpeptidase [Gammaproteobacteria bacterium]
MNCRIEISLATQRLVLFEQAHQSREFLISTARNGAGEQLNSECTPRGRHVIAAKIGAGAAANTVFVGRQATGEIYSKSFAASQPPNRDWILTRVLWLSGCEPGHNQGGERDSYARYIYIHGTPDDTVLGTSGSRGCVRMRNDAVIELFERVTVGCVVDINE